MTSRAFFAFTAFAACIVLAGCSPTARPAETTPTSASSSPSPSSTLAASERLIVTVDGVTYAHSKTEDTVVFSDPKNLLVLVEKAIGLSPTVTKIEDRPGYVFNASAYEWNGMMIRATETHASIRVTKSAVNGIPVQTKQGIAVGSSRADVLSNQGKNPYSDNKENSLALDFQEDPGTSSLSHPGSVGVSYILLPMMKDAVERILSPSNDYTDL